MADLDKLLIHKLNTTLTRNFEQLDLWLYKKVECQFRDEKTWSRTGRVAYSSADVKNRQVLGGIDLLQGVAKHRVEDVVDPGTTAQLLG
jgi:hypothetical protein